MRLRRELPVVVELLVGALELKARIQHVGTDRCPSLSTSGETLTIEESMNLEGENGVRRNVGDEHEWSWSCG
jgi:hypothetical protein